jgi:hypothetical protein
MATYKKRPAFFETEEGLEVRKVLIKMAADPVFNTEASYSANTEVYPDNQIPFVNKHMEYLRTHPAINPRHYIANLRLMTRRK